MSNSELRAEEKIERDRTTELFPNLVKELESTAATDKPTIIKYNEMVDGVKITRVTTDKELARKTLVDLDEVSGTLQTGDLREYRINPAHPGVGIEHERLAQNLALLKTDDSYHPQGYTYELNQAINFNESLNTIGEIRNAPENASKKDSLASQLDEHVKSNIEDNKKAGEDNVPIILIPQISEPDPKKDNLNKVIDPIIKPIPFTSPPIYDGRNENSIPMDPDTSSNDKAIKDIAANLRGSGLTQSDGTRIDIQGKGGELSIA